MVWRLAGVGCGVASLAGLLCCIIKICVRYHHLHPCAKLRGTSALGMALLLVAVAALSPSMGIRAPS